MSTPRMRSEQKLTLKQNLKQQKWLTLIGLPILLFVSFNGNYALWGILFVYWGVVSMRTGEAFLLEPISRDHDPGLFWIITAMWIAFGGWYVLADIYPQALL